VRRGYVFFGLFGFQELLVVVAEELLRVGRVELAAAAVDLLRHDACLVLV